MIVDDLNVDRTDGTFRPLETDPPLVIDPDAVLTLTVPDQHFEPVAGQDGKVPQRHHCLDTVKLQLRGPFDPRECLDPFASGEFPGPFVPIADDHPPRSRRLRVTSSVVLPPVEREG